MKYFLFVFLLLYNIQILYSESDYISKYNITNLNRININDTILNIYINSSIYYFDNNRDFYYTVKHINEGNYAETSTFDVYYKNNLLLSKVIKSSSGDYPLLIKDCCIFLEYISSIGKDCLSVGNLKNRIFYDFYFLNIRWLGYNDYSFYFQVIDTTSIENKVYRYSLADSIKEINLLDSSVLFLNNENTIYKNIEFYNENFQFTTTAVLENDKVNGYTNIVTKNKKSIYLNKFVTKKNNWIISDSSIVYLTTINNMIESVRRIDINGYDEELINYFKICENDDFHLLFMQSSTLNLYGDFLLVLYNDYDSPKPFVYNTKTKKIEDRKINIIWEE